MTTQTLSSVIDHTSDAGFRAWVAELITTLTNAGLVQTADTGQINTTTVTRPAANTEGGYAIFRFNDTQQATAPIFLRIGFGTGGAATTPRMQLTVGTASDGAGTISGAGIAATTFATTTPSSTITAYTTRVCVVNGFCGLMWKLGGASTGLGFFTISRSVDTTGAATAEGASIYTHQASNTPAVTMARYSPAASVAMNTGTFCLIHGGHATSLVGATAQVFKHYLTLPRVRPNAYLLTVLSAEIGNNTTFTATPVGSTSRTYVSSGAQGFQFMGVPAAAGSVLAMIWE